MKLIAQGAEAKLYVDEYLGRKALIKERVQKEYRDKQLDLNIRKARVTQECSLLHLAKEAGVRTPLIYKIDKADTKIWMEFAEGIRLKEFLNSKNVSICKKLGAEIAKLHSHNIIHGDLTTSNVIVGPNKELIFLDFGLGFISTKVEDKATDLLVFKKTYIATHFSLLKGWDYIIKGYTADYPQGKEIVNHIAKIESRVRYH